jgi:hypothetical protein
MVQLVGLLILCGVFAIAVIYRVFIATQIDRQKEEEEWTYYTPLSQLME